MDSFTRADATVLLPSPVLRLALYGSINCTLEAIPRVRLALPRSFFAMPHPDVFSGSEKGICLVFDMNRVFEAFTSLAIAHAINDPNLRIHFQGPQRALVRDALGTEAFRLKPDIVVMHRSGQTLLIADAKWKLIDADDAAHTISAGDVYQMLAYARRYEVNEVVLIYPAQRGLTPSDAISFQIELDHIRLHAFGLDLVDPHSVGSALFQYLRKFGTQPIQLSA